MRFEITSRAVTTALAGVVGISAAQSQEGAAPGDAAAGAAVIGQYCAGCHGPTGRGAMAPSLLGPTWRHGFTDAEVIASIRHGYQDLGMPAFEGILSDTQIRDVLAYIRANPIRGNEGEAGPGGADTPADPMPTGAVRTSVESFRVEEIAQVERPYAFTLLPDDRILVTETGGELRLIEGGRLLTEPIQGIPMGAPPQDPFRRRLLDVAAHPQFAENGWIYLVTAEQEPGISGARGARILLHRGRISKGRWIDNQTLIRSSSWYVSGGRLAFDDNGHVYFGIAHVDPAESDEELSPAQDLAVPMGKILRLNDDGSVPADNPYVDTTGAYPYIWSYGHRNPMGLAFDNYGNLWEVENGPRGGDELNLIKRGSNYGWPIITWGFRYDDKLVAPRPFHDGMEQPTVNWSPTPAFAGLAFYDGDAFPNWKGSLFAGSLKARTLYRLVVNDRQQPLLQEAVLHNIARMRDVRVGPDGYVYILTERELLRLRPAG